MTRENKLALVLGFGLMLFVGILVSDHLAARKAPAVAANMLQVQHGEIVPPMPRDGSDQALVIFGREGPVVVRTDEIDRNPPVVPHPEPAPQRILPPQQNLPQQQIGEPRRPEPVGPQSMPVRTYIVQEGDSFAAIARREYGRTSLGERLAAYNGVNPRNLRAGASIRLPAAEDLDPRMASAQTNSDAPRTPSAREYTVRRGDSLFAIAERELGRGSRWEELKRFNEDVLKGRDALTPGMQIRIPVDA